MFYSRQFRFLYQEYITDQYGERRRDGYEEIKYLEYEKNDFSVIDDELIYFVDRDDISDIFYYKVDYDNKNLFRFYDKPIAQKRDKNEDNLYIYISKPIYFTEYAKRPNAFITRVYLNDRYDYYYPSEVFFNNLLKHDEYKYGNNAQNFVINKNNWFRL